MWNIPIITPLLGYLMKLCYMVLKNYGLALIIFTLIIKLITVPFQIKQQKNTARMAKFQPQLKKLQQKYGNNKEKYQEEMMKLYSEEGVNPMGSCLPMIITMVILFSIIGVVYAPLKYVSNIDSNSFSLTSTSSKTISEAENLVTDTIIIADKMNEEAEGKTYSELSDDEKAKIFKAKVLEDGNKINGTKIKTSSDDMDKALENVERVFSEYYPNNKEFTEFLLDTKKLSSQLYTRPQLLMFKISDNGYGEMFNVVDNKINEELVNIDYTFFGISLSEMPSWTSLYLLIPVSSFLFQLILTFISQRYQKKNNPTAASAGMGMNLMLYIMPIFSFYIAFKFPVGLGLYWTLSSFYSLIQTVILNKIYTPERVEAMVQKDSKKKKKKKGFYQKALEMQQQAGSSNSEKEIVIEDNDEDRKMTKAERKQAELKRLQEARKRMAEKYGEEYKED